MDMVAVRLVSPDTVFRSMMRMITDRIIGPPRVTFAPKKKISLKAAITPELLVVIAEHLSLRALVYYGAVLRIEFPSKVWSKALQDAVPCWTGMPINNPPAFYLAIAKWYFNPKSMTALGAKHVEEWVVSLQWVDPVNFLGMNDAAMENNIRTAMLGCKPGFFTKKGRVLAKELLLEAKDFTSLATDNPEFKNFIDRIVSIFDYRFLLVNGSRLTAGHFF
jgi:hypothetical protein